MTPRRLVTLLAAGFAVLVLGASSCDVRATTESDVGDGSGPDGEWILQSLTVDDSPVDLPGSGPLGLTIDGTSVRGGSGCNSFSGGISAGSDGALWWNDVASTEMGCEDGAQSGFEAIFQQRVFTTDRWTIASDQLTLTGPGVTALYRTKPAPVPALLEDTRWTLDTIFSGSGAMGTASTPDMSRPIATAVFSGGTITLISEDCVDFSFPMIYQPGSAGSIGTPSNVRIGRPDCPDEESNLLVAFFAIMNASEWRIEESHLTFTGSDGDLVRFQADT